MRTKVSAKVAWVLAVAGVVALSAACSSDEPKKVGEVSQGGNVSSSTSNSATTATTAAKASYKAGEVLKVGKLEAVTLSLNPKWTSDNEFIKPSAGKKIVAVEFQLKNTDDEPEAISTLLQFKLKDASNAQYDITFYGPEPRFPDGELAPGDTARGWVPFEVPEGASGFRFIFDAKVFGGGQMVWSL